MVKGIISAFDHMEFCFVIKLTTGGNRGVAWPSVIATRYVCFATVVVVALLFYVHGKHRRSCRDGQLT